MSRYIPPEPFITREVCDVEALNANLQEAHSTLAALNEHNFDSGALNNAEANWATDIGVTLTYNSADIDPYGGSVVTVDGHGQWEPLSDGEITVTTRGGKCLLVASFQIETVLNSTSTRESGMMFAFMVDGAIDHGSILGSADLSNDMIQQAIVPSSYGFPGIDNDTAPALRGGYIPVVLEKVVTLGQGVHTIAIASRNVQPFTISSQSVSQMLICAFDLWA